VASLLIALPLSGHFLFTGAAIALITKTKLRKPKKVPSHFITLDFISFLFKLPDLWLGEKNKDQFILGQQHTFAPLEEQKAIKII